MKTGANRPTRGKKRGARPTEGRAAAAPDALKEAKQASVGQLLFRTARRLNDHALERVQAQTGLAIRASHTALFPLIELKGTRQSVLAERLGVSKQAVNKLVTELVEMGVLELLEDPDDARATLVHFSARKGRTLMDGLAMLASIDRELESTLGARQYRALREGLLGVERWLDEQTSPLASR